MADTFKLSGSIASGAYTTFTPPAGELWIAGPGSIITNESVSALAACNSGGYGTAKVSPASSPHKLFAPFASGTPASPTHFSTGGGSAERTLTLKNTSGGSINYFITGDISTMTNEGIDEAYGSAVQALVAGNTMDGFGPTTGKALLICLAGVDGAGNKLQLVDNTTGTVYISDLGAILPNNARFWLWSALDLKLRFSTVGGSTGSAYVRVVRYVEDSALDEYANRIAVKQAVANGASYDLRPPQGEIWYVDLHNWPSASLYWNGGATPEASTPARASFRVSYDNWVRFTNGTGSSATLLITGTKSQVV